LYSALWFASQNWLRKFAKIGGSLAFQLSLVLAREGDTHAGPAEKAAAEAATQARTATRNAAIFTQKSDGFPVSDKFPLLFCFIRAPDPTRTHMPDGMI